MSSNLCNKVSSNGADDGTHETANDTGLPVVVVAVAGVAAAAAAAVVVVVVVVVVVAEDFGGVASRSHHFPTHSSLPGTLFAVK